MKKGYTLLEMTVALGIFSVISALVVGAFVTTLNLKALTGNLRDSNQKVRHAMEYISRYGKQADKVVLLNSTGGVCTGNCPGVAMYFYTNTNPYREKFLFDGATLKRFECNYDPSNNCTLPPFGPTNEEFNPSGVDLLSGNVNIVNVGTESYFSITSGIIPSLNVLIKTSVPSAAKIFLGDSFKLENIVSLENIK